MDANVIASKLALRIAQLELDKAMLEAKIQELEELNKESDRIE